MSKAGIRSGPHPAADGQTVFFKRNERLHTGETQGLCLAVAIRDAVYRLHTTPENKIGTKRINEARPAKCAGFLLQLKKIIPVRILSKCCFRLPHASFGTRPSSLVRERA
ncbi:MAG: hypothetical protein PHY64_13715 [Eubacteriales bacterium]|nr:hypothetical protein [Eubacteriales bacterium]